MLRSSQRLVAFAILYQAYSSQKTSSNPFISLLVDVGGYVQPIYFWCYDIYILALTKNYF